ncbi:Hypothetical protein DPCES_2995 [Desulfitobacterium hafniense]|uniref:Uncharacterized protein n=1 Tax=Desulfitobacterium hafniense TaxID=49338 RepID=A0A098B3D6_DESHA|nr:Hypothetical protein DPCES_2995 [Desulfitobacterium hafniense]
MFQFLIGKLTTELQVVVRGTLKKFQFLIGKLTTRVSRLEALQMQMFQFLIGKLTTHSHFSTDPHIFSFNSS